MGLQLYRLNCGMEFLGYFGLFDFPSLLKGIYHLPVDDILSTLLLL